MRIVRTGRAAVVCAVIIAIGVPSVAVGFGEGKDLVMGKRNPSTNPSRTLSRETQIIGNVDGYVTRQSNRRSGSGGGAIYGCRSNTGNEACVRGSNLSTGRAFEFDTKGNEGGRIETANASGAPFTTNATGVATGLNADRVDGKEASDFAAAGDLGFASIPAAGTTVTAGKGATGVTRTAAGGGFDYAVVFNRDISACSFTATVVGAPVALGVTPPAASATNTVTVTTATGASAFHLQVIC